jgi:putative membrane protein
MQIFLFLALVLMGVTIIFAVQNTATTMVRFLTWQTEGSLALVLLVAVAVGALISFFFSLPTHARDKWTVRSQRKKMKELEVELDQQNSKLVDSEKRLAEYDESARLEDITVEGTPPEKSLAEDETPTLEDENAPNKHI